jgi:hypothetical protein
MNKTVALTGSRVAWALAASAALVTLIAVPRPAYAAPVTFNMAAVLYAADGDPPAGNLAGWINYDVETGVVSAARLWVLLVGADSPFELTDVDPDADVISAKEEKPIIIRGSVDGESSNKDHKNDVSMLFPVPPSPSGPSVNFSGAFFDAYQDATAAYSLRGTATLAVPEPATWALLGVGLCAVGWTRRHERRS